MKELKEVVLELRLVEDTPQGDMQLGILTKKTFISLLIDLEMYKEKGALLPVSKALKVKVKRGKVDMRTMQEVKVTDEKEIIHRVATELKGIDIKNLEERRILVHNEIPINYTKKITGGERNG